MQGVYDAVVIGSGFGGAITACRLAQAGRSVCVLERGRRWSKGDFPRTIGQLRRAFWNERDHGLLDYRSFKNIDVLQASGVGGGSLVYFNVHMEAPARIFTLDWPQVITRQVLDPYYTLVQDMLDAVPLEPPQGRQLPPRTMAFLDAAQGAGKRADLLKIAVYTGPDRLNPHGGVPQGACVYCGNCGIGCHVHAKNTLDLNYIPLAEWHGAQVFPLHQVEKIERADGGYLVTYRNLEAEARGAVISRCVVVAAGTLGSTELLLRCRDVYKTLPRLSRILGRRFSGNGDFILAGTRTAYGVNPGEGPSITAGVDFSTDGHTIFVEDLGYPEPLIAYLEQLLPNVEQVGSALKLIKSYVLHKLGLARAGPPGGVAPGLFNGGFMTHLLPYLGIGTDAADGQIRLHDGQLDIVWNARQSRQMLQQIEEALKTLSRGIDGKYWPNILRAWPSQKFLTAHPLGGCPMGDNPDMSVVRHTGEVWGYDGLYVVDGSIIPAALGVNPAMTIGALAERSAFWMIHGREMQADDRHIPMAGMPGLPPTWAEQMQAVLYETNAINLTTFPPIHRDDIREGFLKEHDFLSLVLSPDSATLEVSERARLDAFRKAWAEAKRAVDANMIEAFRTAADKLTELFCQALAFKRLENSATLGQLYGRKIDASNRAFQLNVRQDWPLIFACKLTFSDDDVNNAFGLLHRFDIFSDSFALLVAFDNDQILREQVRDSAEKPDFIVLDRDQLWEILAAKSPIERLKDCILKQIDLDAVSPYTVGGAVSERMFFGRAEEERTLRQNISRNDYALLANRKVGKTSLLNKVVPLLDRDPRFKVFYCDLQRVNDYETFYKVLADEYPELRSEIDKLSEASPIDFYKVIINIKHSSGNRQIVLIFDEVDEILEYDLQSKEQLFKTFRSLSQRQNVRFIFSGTTTLVERVRHPNSPLFNFCERMEIGLLDEKAARELVTEPMRTLRVTFENEATILQRILVLTAGHPNLLQYTCHSLIKRINEKEQRTITEADLDILVASQQYYAHFEDVIWGAATAMEKLLVYVMWSYPEFTKANVIAELTRRGLPTEGIEDSLATLQIYSILSRKNGTYTLMFREFAKLMEERNDIAELAESHRQGVLKHDSLRDRRGTES